MTATDRMARLYAKVPEVKGCKAGCGGCCGPVPWHPDEWARVADRAPPTTVLTDMGGGFQAASSSLTGLCAFLQPDKSCGAYDARPLLCRFFGAVKSPLLTCSHGATAARPLSEGKAHKIMSAYHRA